MFAVHSERTRSCKCKVIDPRRIELIDGRPDIQKRGVAGGNLDYPIIHHLCCLARSVWIGRTRREIAYRKACVVEVKDRAVIGGNAVVEINAQTGRDVPAVDRVAEQVEFEEIGG